MPFKLPISILHPIAKLLEKCVNERLRAYLEATNAFRENQFGFRERRLTELVGLLVSQR